MGLDIDLISAKEAAKKWGISQASVRCSENRIPGASMLGNMWVIPADAEKPYGSGPLFIYYPDEKSNASVRSIHVNVMNRWGYMQQYRKMIF